MPARMAPSLAITSKQICLFGLSLRHSFRFSGLTYRASSVRFTPAITSCLVPALVGTVSAATTLDDADGLAAGDGRLVGVAGALVGGAVALGNGGAVLGAGDDGAEPFESLHAQPSRAAISTTVAQPPRRERSSSMRRENPVTPGQGTPLQPSRPCLPP